MAAGSPSRLLPSRLEGDRLPRVGQLVLRHPLLIAQLYFLVAGFQKATRGGKSAKTGAGYKYFSFCHLS